MDSATSSEQLRYPLLPQYPEQPATDPPLEPVLVEQSEPVRPTTACMSERKKGCGFLLGFIILQVLVMVCELITLLSGKWMTYCFWEFSLLDGKSDSDRFGESGSFSALKDEYCDSYHSQQNAINDYCPMFCSNILILAKYSSSMCFAGILTLVVSLLAIYVHVKALIKEEYKFGYIDGITAIPLVLWVAGWGVYCIGTLRVYNPEKRNHDTEDDPAETELGEALCMCIGVSFLQLLLFLYVRFLTRKSFL